MNKETEYLNLMKKISFHDSTIIKYYYKNEDLFIELLDGWLDQIKWRIEFKNATIEGNNLENDQWIKDYDYKILDDNKYYLRLDNTTIKSYKVLVEKYYVSNMMAKYTNYTDLFIQNFDSIKEYFDEKLLNFIKNNVILLDYKINDYIYENNNLTINYTYLLTNFSITFSNLSNIKLNINYDCHDIKEIDEIIKKINNKRNNDFKEKLEYFKNIFPNEVNLEDKFKKIMSSNNNYKLSVKKIDNIYECSILLLYDKQDEIEIIFTCDNIIYKEV